LTVTAPKRSFDPHKGYIRAFNVLADLLPLVVEDWSPSTCDYDREARLECFRQPDDAEIWLFQPYERTLATWRR
jgi:hypothetical protein